MQREEYQCEKCDYTSCRKDRVKRHLLGVHLSKKAPCECGTLITPSVLGRHQRESCTFYKNNPHLLKKRGQKRRISSDLIQDKKDVDVKTGKFEFNYRIDTSDNGELVITHDEIIINGIQMTLVPSAMIKDNIQNDEEVHALELDHEQHPFNEITLDSELIGFGAEELVFADVLNGIESGK